MDGKHYRDLAKHLDRLPGGFPPSETGAEIRLLERLFTPDEAGPLRRCPLYLPPGNQ
jgi:hypothetical protein